MSRGEKSGNWFKRHKILTSILAFIILCCVVSAAGGGKQVKTTAETKTATAKTETKSTNSTAKEAPPASKVSQSAAEKYCEDAGLLGKYIDISKTSIVVATSYKPQYNDSGTKASNGDAIYDFQWSGKNKSTGASILFTCSVSGTDKSITLHTLAIDGQAVYGTVDEQ